MAPRGENATAWKREKARAVRPPLRRAAVSAGRAAHGDDVSRRETVFPVCSPERHPHASGFVCRSRRLQEMHEDNPEIDRRNRAMHFGLRDDVETKIVR